jgi:hypothetical protein
MSTEPTWMHLQTNRMNASGQVKTYVAEKLRGAAVMYGPAVVLDLFEGVSVLLTALGRLPDAQGSRAARILRPIMAVGALAPWVYLLIVRPWHTSWGATDEDVCKRLPGDELVPHPALKSTRAITIRAPAEEVWRWLVQLGHDRGGFYSYDRLENLAGADIHNVDWIVPQMQHLKVGDFVPMAPVEWGVPMGGFTVVAIEPERAVVWRQGWPDDIEKLSPLEAESRGTWAFVLEEVDEGTTRLLLRERSGLKPRMRDMLLNYLFIERQHFIMERRMLLGIKERAERAQAARSGEDEKLTREPGRTLLNEVLPVYEFRGRETIRVNASAEQTFRALQELTIAEAAPALVRTLISLRYLPGRLTGRGRTGQVDDEAQPFRQAMLSDGNVVLAEEPGREVVVGTIGKFHNLTGQQPVPVRNADEFARFDEPGYQKLAMGWRTNEGDGGGCELVMEHRTHALSPGSRRKFALYWWLMIKAGSAVLARMLLRAIKRRAEQAYDA